MHTSPPVSPDGSGAQLDAAPTIPVLAMDDAVLTARLTLRRLYYCWAAVHPEPRLLGAVLALLGSSERPLRMLGGRHGFQALPLFVAHRCEGEADVLYELLRAHIWRDAPVTGDLHPRLEPI